MRRILLTAAYDGTEFHGFAFQEGVRTVEGALNEAIALLTGETVRVIGASRTDAGVHALGNLAAFDTASRIPAERFPDALNTVLPADLRITEACETEEGFHPRRTGWAKTYEYRIVNAKRQLPTERRYTFHYRSPLRAEEMDEAVRLLVGTHDFTSFCSVHSLSETRERTLLSAQVQSLPLPEEKGEGSFPRPEGGRLVVIRVTGTGFLYHMVRIMAGTLLEVGRGRIAPAHMTEILHARDRTRAGATLPPEGLFLMGYERKW